MQQRMSTTMLIMQLADSAFPAGGLNHSQGLEAAMQSGRVTSPAGLKLFAIEVLHLQVMSHKNKFALMHSTCACTTRQTPA